MKTSTRMSQHLFINEQGARALIGATLEFLRRNHISRKSIDAYARQYWTRNKIGEKFRLYNKLMRAYEDVGVLMATWFSHPSFLDKAGRPLPLATANGPQSIADLIRASRVRVPKYLALELMRRSPSINSNNDGTLVAIRRVFVLPEFEVPRAALVVERYLDTLGQNASSRRNDTALLLERSCHVSEVDLRKIAPILRDIKWRGAAFMDSVDGEIEECRLQQRPKQKAVGELGVLVFAWTRPNNRGSSKTRSISQTAGK
jgi:hypothetical protein